MKSWLVRYLENAAAWLRGEPLPLPADLAQRMTLHVLDELSWMCAELQFDSAALTAEERTCATRASNALLRILLDYRARRAQTPEERALGESLDWIALNHPSLDTPA